MPRFIGATLGLSAPQSQIKSESTPQRSQIAEQLCEGYENEIIDIEESRKCPNLIKSIQSHHMMPKYLGEVEEGLHIALDARYHTAITQACQDAYSNGHAEPSADVLLAIVQTVYTQVPISLHWDGDDA